MHQFLQSPEDVKKASKLGTLIEFKNRVLYVSIVGTKSVLNLQPVSIFVGIKDWFLAAFSITKVFEVDGNLTWAS